MLLIKQSEAKLTTEGDGQNFYVHQIKRQQSRN